MSLRPDRVEGRTAEFGQNATQRDFFHGAGADNRRPPIACLVGSTRFRAEFEAETEARTRAGEIVLTVGCFDRDKEAKLGAEAAARLDRLHLEKIRLADRVVVINPLGYVGASTKREVLFALAVGKPLEWAFATPPAWVTEPEKYHYLSFPLLVHVLDYCEAVRVRFRRAGAASSVGYVDRVNFYGAAARVSGRFYGAIVEPLAGSFSAVAEKLEVAEPWLRAASDAAGETCRCGAPFSVPCPDCGAGC